MNDFEYREWAIFDLESGNMLDFTDDYEKYEFWKRQAESDEDLGIVEYRDGKIVFEDESLNS